MTITSTQKHWHKKRRSKNLLSSPLTLKLKPTAAMQTQYKYIFISFLHQPFPLPPSHYVGITLHLNISSMRSQGNGVRAASN